MTLLEIIILIVVCSPMLCALPIVAPVRRGEHSPDSVAHDATMVTEHGAIEHYLMAYDCTEYIERIDIPQGWHLVKVTTIGEYWLGE